MPSLSKYSQDSFSHSIAHVRESSDFLLNVSILVGHFVSSPKGDKDTERASQEKEKMRLREKVNDSSETVEIKILISTIPPAAASTVNPYHHLSTQINPCPAE